MNVSSVSPVTLAAVPGRVATRNVTVHAVDQAAPADVEVTVSVTAAGNEPTSTSVLVTLDPEDATPAATVDVPEGAGITATIGAFTPVMAGPGVVDYWTAVLTITTV